MGRTIKYTPFLKNIKEGLANYSKLSIKNQEDLLYDVFDYLKIENFHLIEELNDEKLIHDFNLFLDNYHYKFREGKEQIMSSLENSIKGTPLSVALSHLIRTKINISEKSKETHSINMVTTYYKNLLSSIDLLISNYRGYLKFEIMSKSKLDAFDIFGNYLIKSSEDIKCFENLLESEKQSLETLLDRCSIMIDGKSYIARIPFGADGKINIEPIFVKRKEISKALCYYQLNFSDEFEPYPIQSDTILDIALFMEYLFKFFHYINNRVTKNDIIIFIATLENNNHDQFKNYDRNAVRSKLSESFIKYPDATLIFRLVLKEAINKNIIGNKSNLFSMMSKYFLEVKGLSESSIRNSYYKNWEEKHKLTVEHLLSKQYNFAAIPAH